MKYHLDGRIAAYDKDSKRYFICLDTQSPALKENYYRSGSAEENRIYYFKTFASLREHSFDRAVENIRHLLGRNKVEVLDIGCLYGQFLNKVIGQGWEGIGIEPSKNEAEFARNTYNAEVVETTIEDFVPDKQWDVITLWDVFEHLADPLSVIDKVKSMLKDDGILIIRVPNANGLIHRLAFLIYAVSFGIINFPLVKLFENHLYIYSENAVIEILEAKGFKVILSYGECMIFPRVDVIRQKRYIKKIPKPFQGLLSHIIVSVLRLSEVISMKDSLVVYSRQSR